MTIPRALQLYRGGILSYYEPVLPGLAKALTDSDWRRVLEGGSTPPSPSWSGEFLRPIRASTEVRLRAGEALEDGELWRRDPVALEELDDALDPWQAVREDRVLRGDPVALEEAAWEGYRKVWEGPDPAASEEAGWGGYLIPRDAREERARRLLDIWLALAGGGEDCGRIVEAVKGTRDTYRLVQLASRFAEIASDDDRRELFEAVPGGHPHLAILALHATDRDAPLDEVRRRLGESVLGRWALALVLEERAPSVEFDDRALFSLEDDSEDAPGAEDALFRAEEVIEGTVDPGDIEALAELATKDPSFLVRAHAMHALASYPREHAVPVLRRGLEDESPAVRGLAALGLIEKRDLASFPLISRLLFWLDDPANRERARREGEEFGRLSRLRATGPLLGNTSGFRAGPLMSALFDRLGAEWTASFSAARFVEEPENRRFQYELRTHDPDLWRRLVVAIAGDPYRPPEERHAVLDIDFDGREPETARALAPLLDDTSVVGPDGVRIADLAAQAIVQALREIPPDSVRGDTPSPPRDPAERVAALVRARAALEEPVEERPELHGDSGSFDEDP